MIYDGRETLNETLTRAERRSLLARPRRHEISKQARRSPRQPCVSPSSVLPTILRPPRNACRNTQPRFRGRIKVNFRAAGEIKRLSARNSAIRETWRPNNVSSNSRERSQLSNGDRFFDLSQPVPNLFSPDFFIFFVSLHLRP